MHRALNIELYRIMLAKLDNDTSTKSEIGNILDWIKQIAINNGYTTIERRCSEIRSLLRNDLHFSPEGVNITSKDIVSKYN